MNNHNLFYKINFDVLKLKVNNYYLDKVGDLMKKLHINYFKMANLDQP